MTNLHRREVERHSFRPYFTNLLGDLLLDLLPIYHHVYLRRSVDLHEVFNVEVIQSVPWWWRLSWALGDTRGHLQTHFISVGYKKKKGKTGCMWKKYITGAPGVAPVAGKAGLMGAPGAPGFSTQEKRVKKTTLETLSPV